MPAANAKFASTWKRRRESGRSTTSSTKTYLSKGATAVLATAPEIAPAANVFSDAYGTSEASLDGELRPFIWA